MLIWFFDCKGIMPESESHLIGLSIKSFGTSETEGSSCEAIIFLRPVDPAVWQRSHTLSASHQGGFVQNIYRGLRTSWLLTRSCSVWLLSLPTIKNHLTRKRQRSSFRIVSAPFEIRKERLLNTSQKHYALNQLPQQEYLVKGANYEVACFKNFPSYCHVSSLGPLYILWLYSRMCLYMKFVHGHVLRYLTISNRWIVQINWLRSRVTTELSKSRFLASSSMTVWFPSPWQRPDFSI